MKPQWTRALLNASGVFYAVLCVFSLVTGLMYAIGNRALNPVELSDAMLSRLSEPGALERFAVIMGWVTFAVGIVQGVTAFSLFKKGKKALYCIALGFTLFSICSVGYKILGKFSLFAFSKTAAYIAILIVLLLPASRKLFSFDTKD